MKEKIKVLSICLNKHILKKQMRNKTLYDNIESVVPDTYEFIYTYISKNILKEIEEYQPKIVFMTQNESKDTLGLLKEIKQLMPSVAVFVLLSDLIEDEQGTIDEYMGAGAYKCLFSALSVNSLAHDMYVALNLE